MPGVGLSGDLFQRHQGRFQGIEKRVLVDLRYPPVQVVVHVLEGFAGLFTQGLGFAAAGRAVEEVLVERLEGSDLRGGELNLWFQHHVAVAVSVTQGALQLAVLQDVPVETNFHLATGTQVGQGAENRGVIPAVGFAFELFQQALEGGADTAPIVALNERQHFLLGFRQGRGVVTEKAIVCTVEAIADVVFRVGNTAQHAEVGVSP